jgi:ERCC4-related helicase
MLLDNKTITEDNKYCKVFDFIKNYTEKGELDLVTGFFSVNALALLYDEINDAEKFRLILGKLMQEDASMDKIINLLSDNFSIDSTLAMNQSARKAVKFLQQEKVAVKTIERNFCHAKSYIYRDNDSRKNFHIIGSSNLTDAGLGLRDSSNIELNTAATGDSNDFRELRKWFKKQWDNVAQDKMELPDKSKVDVKQYIIELIQKLFKEYTPEDLYYKVLYERFKDDFNTFTNDAEFKREIAHLEETVIFQTLFSYQQKGVLSIINMLQKYNGAILADAVGLGKTWTALAVMKYFEMKGYTVMVFCPKKLRHNWAQYTAGSGSRFEKDDISYFVRHHTDLQDERLTVAYPDFPLSKIQRKKKLLLVIDESHNLRNDKSARYKFLVENILLPENKSRDIKVLHLSATPINNGLIDVRNQVKIIAKGADNGFNESSFKISSLENIFRTAQREFTLWSKTDNRKISDYIAKLSDDFYRLTDSLIVARTRKLIEGEFGAMNFPQKEIPVNEYITPKNIGILRSFDDILEAIKVKMTAYRPSEYIREREKAESVLKDEKQREGFLVKMMYILLIKRLESSWFSFQITVDTILNHHLNALDKVNQFIETKKDISILDDLSEEEQEELEDTANEIEQPLTLGKKNPVALSEISDIERFKTDLENDIEKLNALKENLVLFQKDFETRPSSDPKLEKLLAHIKQKQQSENKKALIFTVYRDTAKFLYNELKKQGINNLAYVSGSLSETIDGYSGDKFEPVLERFAPFTKLYNEKDWSDLYEKANLGDEFKADDKWNVPYNKWKELIQRFDKTTLKKIECPIDVLIATDCLSEGQNLQDCDLVINYDIHWNPVRLIQRMGRIDRLGSPNKTIRGINFWPAKDYEDYLKLKNRVENRMAVMTVVGTEFDDKLTPELQRMVAENPLISKQTQKMLDQLQLTWEDVEVGEQTLGLDDLSLEQFRQELFELFRKKEEFFKQIPNGVFTGFKYRHFQPWQTSENSLVAVLGYPRRPDDAADHVYDEIRLLHSSYRNGNENISFLQNDMEILALLRHHKSANRYVPKEIESGDKAVIANLSKAVSDWLQSQATPVAVNQIQDLFSGNISPLKITPEQKKTEEKFKAENFDLINWFVISNK